MSGERPRGASPYQPTPPRLALRLLRRTLPPHDRPFIVSDLIEEFEEVCDPHGLHRARRWFWVQTLGSLPTSVRQRWWSARERRRSAGATAMGWHEIGRELHRSTRRLIGRPTWTFGIVATLALGIGANAGLFQVVDGVLFRPPAFLTDPETVHRIYFEQSARGETVTGEAFGHSVFQELAADASTLSTLAAHFTGELVVGAGEERRLERVMLVSGSFWSLFDATPVVGRLFDATDDRLPAGRPVAVLAHAHWITHHGGDRGVVGTHVPIGSRTYEIVGVAPPGMLGLARQSVVAFVPVTAGGEDIAGPGFADRPFTTWLTLVGRRAVGAAPEAVEAELSATLRAVWERVNGPEVTERWSPRIVVGPVLRDRGPLRAARATTSLWLLATSVLVLMIACLNIANLLLARALEDRRDLAIRAALGGRPARFAISTLAESMTLSVLGGLLAIPTAIAVTRLTGARLFPDVVVASTDAVARVAAFVLLLVPLTGLLTAAGPLLRVGRLDVASLIQSGGRTTAAGSSPARAVLMVLQASLCAVLLVGTGLFTRSFIEVATLDHGYDPDRIVVVQPDLRGGNFSTSSEADELVLGILERARDVSGVEGAALSATVPFLRNSYDGVSLEDGTRPEGRFATHSVSAGYFRTMGTPIVRGRELLESDDAGAPPVVVVSESMARALWGTGDALEQCLVLRSDAPCARVVGVARDIRRGNIRDAEGTQYYAPHEQYGRVPRVLLVHARPGAREGVVQALRAALAEVVPASVFLRIEPLSERVDLQTVTWTAGAKIFGALGLVAVVLAALGLFSLLAYDVARSARDLGIRLAFGSERRGLVGLVLRRGVTLVVLGTGLGLRVAYLVGGRIDDLLFQVSPHDPATFLGVASVLVATACVAALVPAVRASRVDPVRLLRAD